MCGIGLIRRRFVLRGVVLAVLAGPAMAGEFSATLKPAADATGPWARASLSLQIAEGTGDIRRVALQPISGGPTVVYPVTLAPGRATTLEVSLPAISVEQTYRVRLLGQNDSAGPTAEAPVAWPVGQLCRKQLLQPDRCLGYEADLPAWPGRTRRAIFLAGVIFCVLLAGATLIRRARLRVLLVVLILLAGPMLLWPWAETASTEILTQEGGLRVFAVRRTRKVTVPPGLLPIYADPGQFQRDTLRLVNRQGGTVRIRPDRPRLFVADDKSNAGN